MSYSDRDLAEGPEHLILTEAELLEKIAREEVDVNFADLFMRRLAVIYVTFEHWEFEMISKSAYEDLFKAYQLLEQFLAKPVFDYVQEATPQECLAV